MFGWLILVGTVFCDWIVRVQNYTIICRETLTSLQVRFTRGVFSNVNHIPRMSLHCKLVPVQYREYDTNLFLMIFPCMSLHCKLVPVQYPEYDINLFLMIFPCMSLQSKLGPVQYREYDINLFLMIFPCMSLQCKLVPVHYREYEYGLLLIAVLTETCCENYGSGMPMTEWQILILDLSWTEHLDSIGNSCI